MKIKSFATIILIIICFGLIITAMVLTWQPQYLDKIQTCPPKEIKRGN